MLNSSIFFLPFYSEKIMSLIWKYTHYQENKLEPGFYIKWTIIAFWFACLINS